ncbi:MAG: hypothetical protein TU36_006565 [Vulcanisaeta sp. AZ3]|nr:MAG: hypothetical protein TU36_02350 [Vulcanisaeta sp. AZ3]
MNKQPNPEVLECLYQLINYVDDEEGTLVRDAQLRYGDSYIDICRQAKDLKSSLGEGINNVIRRLYDLLADYVMDRIRGLGDAAYALARYMGLGGLESVLRVQFRLMGFSENTLENLIRAGVLMHRSKDILFVPEYLISRFLAISSSVMAPNIREVLSNVNVKGLLIIEAAAFNAKPIGWLFRAIYGLDFKDLIRDTRIDNIVDGSLGEPILSPIIDVQELRALIHEMKDSGARSLRRALGPHGQYMYSKVVRCGVVYTVFGEGGRELILLCPWVLPSKRLLDYHAEEDRVMVIGWKPSQDFADAISRHSDDAPTRTGFVFISNKEAMVYKPRLYDQSFDSFLDFLYRSNLKVSYLN